VFAVPDEGPSLVRKIAHDSVYITCFNIAYILCHILGALLTYYPEYLWQMYHTFTYTTGVIPSNQIG
jgi:hypothetical protein